MSARSLVVLAVGVLCGVVIGFGLFSALDDGRTAVRYSSGLCAGTKPESEGKYQACVKQVIQAKTYFARRYFDVASQVEIEGDRPYVAYLSFNAQHKPVALCEVDAWLFQGKLIIGNSNPSTSCAGSTLVQSFATGPAIPGENPS